MIGQRSVERPRRVSTDPSGDDGRGDAGAIGKGLDAVRLVVFGAVPRERAAITS